MFFRLIGRITAVAVLLVTGCAVDSTTADSEGLAGAAPAPPDSPLRFAYARNMVLFSPRWNSSRGGTGHYIENAEAFHANALVWHYMRDAGTAEYDDFDIARWAQSTGRTLNCALPAITFDPEAACIEESTGRPKVFYGNAYVPDTTRPAWRAEVRQFLESAAAEGCDSLHQDNSFMMYVRRTKVYDENGQPVYDEDGNPVRAPDECYRSLYERNPRRLRRKVFRYYNWLHRQVEQVFGEPIPMSFNHGINTDDESDSERNLLADWFHIKQQELKGHLNYPQELYDNVFLNRSLGLTTVMTLRDRGLLANQRFSASLYALGAHPIAPYDVWITMEEPRFFADPRYFDQLYSFVREGGDLLNGHGIRDVFISHWQNDADRGVIRHRGELKVAQNKPHVLATLAVRPSERKASVHLVNWSAEDRPFTFWVDRDALSFTPTRAILHRPGRAPVELPVHAATQNRWRVSTHTLDLWGIVALRP